MCGIFFNDPAQEKKIGPARESDVPVFESDVPIFCPECALKYIHYKKKSVHCKFRIEDFASSATICKQMHYNRLVFTIYG